MPKEDSKIFEKTFKKKKFALKAFQDGQISQKMITNKLKDYVKDLNDKKRNVKILMISLMAHGERDDTIIFSDQSSCRYKYDH